MKVIDLYIKIRNKIERIFTRFFVEKSKYCYGLNTKPRDFHVVVSLTTFPKRISQLDLCLKSILLQRFKPDKIVVWLGSDSKKSDYQFLISKFSKYGIEFCFDENNDFKSHKKYIYAFNNYPNSIIITLDDDLIYPNDILLSLIKKYKKYPNCIIARRVHKIQFDGELIKPYNEWIYECHSEKEPSNLLVATTGAGTLFPPNIMPSDSTCFDIIKDYSLTTDDLWLKFIELSNNIKVVWVGDLYQLPETVEKVQEVALRSVNVFQDGNDVNIKKLMTYFDLKKDDFYK